MKYYSLVIISFVLLFAFTCKFRSGSSIRDNVEFAGKLYHYAATSDEHFCNPDSIIQNECGGGELYFTKRGNVVRTFDCYGNDSSEYSLGKYSVRNNSIVCTFNRSYAFYNGFKDDGLLNACDPNDGAMKKTREWIILIKKPDCDAFDFYFLSDDKEKFILVKLNEEDRRAFFDDFKKIKELSDM
jgi:hypothetical protein